MNAALLFLLISIAASLAEERRIVSGQVVEVTANWIQVRGSYVGESPFGWILDGTYGTNSGRFILKNPPVEKLAEFTRLKQAKDYLTTECERVTVQSEQTRHLHINRRYSRIKQGQIRALDSQTKTNASEIQQIESDAKNKGYNLSGALIISDSALRMGQTYQKMPVFDRGTLVKQSSSRVD